MRKWCRVAGSLLLVLASVEVIFHLLKISYFQNYRHSVITGGVNTAGIWESPFTDQERNATQSRDMSNPYEVQHVAFLKVHKAASTTVQTMLFRFGYTRNLDIVLPAVGNYFSRTTNSHKALLPPVHGKHYDIFCMHCTFNYSTISDMMPKKTFYIAIVRDPLSQFISAFNYYLNVYKLGYLKRIPGRSIVRLIQHPKMYEPSVLSYTMNSMAKDFGFLPEHYFQNSTGNVSSNAHAYLDFVDGVFDLVMVAEWFDESLILMKRMLKWSLKDILYISKNVKKPKTSIKPSIVTIFKKRNSLDYLLYNHFVRKFERKMKAGGKGLQEETKHFRELCKIVLDWCNGDRWREYTIPQSKWNKMFKIDREFCRLLEKDELPFIDLLRKKALSILNQE